MRDALTFRLAREADIESLVGFVQQLRADDPDEGPFDEDATRAAIPPMIVNPQIGRIWLIEIERELAGYVALTFAWSIELGGRVAFIDELFIAQPFRRQGVGAAALEFVSTTAAALDIKSLLLEVTCSNDPAARLYTRHGFADRGHRLMVKRISSPQ